MNKLLSFKYTGFHNNPSKELDCYYSDDYFKQSAYQYNPSLATTSIYMAIACYGHLEEKSYDNHDKNIRELMAEMEFEKGEANSLFNRKPTRDSIGCYFASKKISSAGEDYTLIALAIRGGGYEAEWASNFTLGAEGYHQGFFSASQIIIEDLNNYLVKHKIEGQIKLWIAGFSRAAATANIVAGRLDQNPQLLNDKVSLNCFDLYAYTFETPAGALLADGIKNEKYHNIFNILNPLDPVIYIMPENMGFGRFGRDIEVEELLVENKELFANLSEQYQAITGKPYPLSGYFHYHAEDGKVEKIRQIELIKAVINRLSTIPRARYVETSQEYAREVFSKNNAGVAFDLLNKHMYKKMPREIGKPTEQDKLNHTIFEANNKALATAHFAELAIAWMRLFDPNFGAKGLN